MTEQKQVLQLSTGFLISVEGIDGAGKGTVVEMFLEALKASHIDAVSFSDLSTTEVGKAVRGFFLSKPAEDADAETKANYEANRPLPDTEALLITAARNENILRNVIPALSAGKVVIMDRFTDSTEVYQHNVKGCEYGTVSMGEMIACRGVKPQLTFWVNTSPAVASERMAACGKQDYHESKGRDFHEAVWVSFARLHQNNITRISTISGDKSLDKVREEVYGAVGHLIRMFARGGFLPKEWIEIQSKEAVDRMSQSIAAADAETSKPALEHVDEIPFIAETVVTE